MGIYDREYIRDESGGGWFSGPNPATRTFVAIHVLVFVVQILGGGQDLFNWCAANGTLIFEGLQVHRLLTASFIQPAGGGNLLTFVFQMLILYWVGRDMEGIYGSREFTYTYLSACLISTAGWAMFDYFGPGKGQGIYFGPGGPVAAILVLFTLYYPMREVLLFFVLPVKMWILLVVFLGYDVVMLISTLRVADRGGLPPGGSIFFGHLAGAAYGWAYKALDIRWTRWLTFNWSRRPRLRVVEPEPAQRYRPGRPVPSRPSGSSPFNEDLLDAQVDDILAKIAREGPASLTDVEKSILEEASRRAKNRRGERLS